ncbi:MAG: hypothetical protein B6U76_09335 [Desulfurococcales archaeon ex4484_217_2]|nr:MAG: hypothetical protein B6U76_09335 [Desulfurococcales archaeon ex4484_217_2]
MIRNLHVRESVLALIFALAMLLSAVSPVIGYEIQKTKQADPIAIGYGVNERYILYSNGTIYEIGEEGFRKTFTLRKEALESIRNSTINFEIHGNILFLYAHSPLNASKGASRIYVYDMNDNKLLFYKEFTYTIVNNTVKGILLISASGSAKGLVLLVSNGSNITAETYVYKNSKFTKKFTYDGKVAFTIYKHGPSLLLPTLAKTMFRNREASVPVIVNALTNKTVFRLPSLIPVVVLAYPLIQIFKCKGEWFSYIVVYNRLTNRVEYYVSKADSMRFEEHSKVIVSPWLDYMVEHIPTVNASKIMFKDGYSIVVGKDLSITPRGIFLPIDSPNSILDARIKGHVALVKITKGNITTIYLIDCKGKLHKVYKINSEYAFKTKGFYAAILNKKAYILDPLKKDLIEIDISEFISEETSTTPEKTEKEETAEAIYCIVAVIMTLAILIIGVAIIFKYRRGG